MKRSVILNVIKMYLEIARDSASLRLPPDMNAMSDILLYKLEELGMLPPEIDKTIEGHLCSINEWEKE